MNYSFDGRWSFKLDLNEFKQLTYENEGAEVDIEIRDFLDDEIEPSEQQVNTINYIIQHQDSIVKKMLETIWLKWAEIDQDYSIEDYEDFPKISMKEDLRKVFNIHTIYIQALYKEDYAYFGLEGSCMWDEEHGIGFLLHKSRLVAFGDAEEADAGGREANDSPENSRPSNPEFLKSYPPHPRYGTFKPSHKQANIDYPHELIKQKQYEDFLRFLETNPDLDFVHPEDFQERTYLQSACFWDNKPVFDFLIDKVSNLEKAIFKAHKRKNILFIERLIQKGGNIHEAYMGTTIFTDAVEHYLRLVAGNLTQEQMDANHQRMVDFYKNKFIDKYNPVAKEMRLHPKVKIEQAKQYILKLKDYRIELDENKINYVKSGFRNTPEALVKIEKELSWIIE